MKPHPCAVCPSLCGSANLCYECGQFWVCDSHGQARLTIRTLDAIGVPRRFHAASVDGLASALSEWTGAAGDGLYLHGPVGTGKTHAAVALLSVWAKRNPRYVAAIRFVRTPSFFQSIRRTFDAETRGADPMDGAMLAPLLVLDDLSAERITDWTRERMDELVDVRWSQMRPTIFTSNEPLEKVFRSHGSRIASRIRGSCRIVEVEGPDRREMAS